MLAGMVVFAVVSAVVHLRGQLASNTNLNKVLQVSVLAISFILIKTGLNLFKRKLQSIDANATALQKIDVYRTSAIIKWVMMEVPVLLSVISFMFTRNYAFMVLAFVLMILFAMQGPLRQNIQLQLNISEQEMAQLEQG
jgi:hypothetical protein